MAITKKIDTLFKDAVEKTVSDMNSHANHDEYSDIASGGSATETYLGNVNMTSMDIQGTSGRSKPTYGVGEYSDEY